MSRTPLLNQAVEIASAYFERRDSLPVFPHITPEQLRQALGAGKPVPEQGQAAEQVIAELARTAVQTRKIAPYRHKYPEWWLVLVDRIGYGVEACDEQLFREHLKFDHNWDKIMLVHPLNPSSVFELL